MEKKEISVQDMTCVFCRHSDELSKGKNVTGFIGESAHSYAVLDKHPIAQGHALIVPKKHFEKIPDMPQAELADAIALVSRVESALLETIAPEGLDVRQHYRPWIPENEYKVNHVHFHVLPRYSFDKVVIRNPRIHPTPEQLDETAAGIAEHLKPLGRQKKL